MGTTAHGNVSTWGAAVSTGLRRCGIAAGLVAGALVASGLAATPSAAAEPVSTTSAGTSLTAGAVGTVTASRVLDTRFGVGVDALPVRSGGDATFTVTGRGGVPATGVSAVVLNVTVTNPATSGFITAYAGGSGLPLASNLNFSGGQTVANLVVAPVGLTGSVSLRNGSAGQVDLVADLQGYVIAGTPATAGAFGSVAPKRVMDTRSDGRGALVSGETRQLTVAGRAGVPAGVSAVVLNVTATNPTSSGFITAAAAGSPPPLASNLNFDPGQTVPNLVVLPVGSDGAVGLRNGSPGTVDLVADVQGFFVQGRARTPGAFSSLPPTRVLDTRTGVGARSSVVASGGSVVVRVAGRSGVPATGVGAVVLNVTVTDTAADGFITAFPGGGAPPSASNLNFVRGRTVPNAVVVPLGSDGSFALRNGSPGSVQLVADAQGYISSGKVDPFDSRDTWSNAFGGAASRDTFNPGESRLTSATTTVLRQAWSRVPRSEPNSFTPYTGIFDPPIVADGTAYVISGGAVEAVDVTTGESRWSTSFSDLIGPPRPATVLTVGTAALLGNSLVVNGSVRGTATGFVLALDIRTRQLAWRTTFTMPNDYIVGRMAVNPQVILTEDDSNNLIALDPVDGRRLWTAAHVRSPIASPETAFVNDSRTGQLLALSARTGAVRWSANAGSVMAVAGDTLITRGTAVGEALAGFAVGGCNAAVCQPQWTRGAEFTPSDPNQTTPLVGGADSASFLITVGRRDIVRGTASLDIHQLDSKTGATRWVAHNTDYGSTVPPVRAGDLYWVLSYNRLSAYPVRPGSTTNARPSYDTAQQDGLYQAYGGVGMSVANGSVLIENYSAGLFALRRGDTG